MVGGRHDGAKTIRTCRNSGSNENINSAIDRCSINTLEKGKFRRIGRRDLSEISEQFDNDVGMSDNETLRIHLLWRRKVVLLSVDKVTKFDVVCVQNNRESSIGLDGTKVLRECEFGAGHGGRCWYDTDWGIVARARGDLLSIGQREVGSVEAVIDKVVDSCP